jgi:hypothetical protein
LLHPRQLNALGLIGDRLPVGPPRRRDAPAKIDDRFVRKPDFEGANLTRRGAKRHLGVTR